MANPDYSEMLAQQLKVIDEKYYNDTLDATALANADLSKESHFHHDLVKAQERLQAAIKNAADINTINQLASSADLVTKKMAGFAENASKKAVQANAGVAVGTSNIETASTAIVELTAHLSSVLRTAKIEDGKTSMESSASLASKMANQLGYEAEQLSLKALRAAELASQTVNAASTLSAAKELEKEIDAIAAKVKTLFDNALEELNTARDNVEETEERYNEELQEFAIDTDDELALDAALQYLNQETNLNLTAFEDVNKSILTLNERNAPAGTTSLVDLITKGELHAGRLGVSYDVYVKPAPGGGWFWDPFYDPADPTSWDPFAKKFEEFRILILPTDQSKDFDLSSALALSKSNPTEYNVIPSPTSSSSDPIKLESMCFTAYQGPGSDPEGYTITGAPILMGTSYEVIFWAVPLTDHKLNIARETDLSLPSEPVMLNYQVSPAEIIASYRDEKNRIHVHFKPSKPTGEGLIYEYWAFAIRDTEIENFEGYLISPKDLQASRRMVLANHIQQDNATPVGADRQHVIIPAEMTDFFGVPVDPTQAYYVYILTVGNILNILSPGSALTNNANDPIPFEGLLPANLEVLEQQKVPNVLSIYESVSEQIPDQAAFTTILNTDFYNDVLRLIEKSIKDLEDMNETLRNYIDALFATADQGSFRLANLRYARLQARRLLTDFEIQGNLQIKDLGLAIEALKVTYPNWTRLSSSEQDDITDLLEQLENSFTANQTQIGNLIENTFTNRLNNAISEGAAEVSADEQNLAKIAQQDLDRLQAEGKQNLLLLNTETTNEQQELKQIQNTAAYEHARQSLNPLVEAYVEAVANQTTPETEGLEVEIAELRQDFGDTNEQAKRLVGYVMLDLVEQYASADEMLKGTASVGLQEILNIIWTIDLDGEVRKDVLAKFLSDIQELENILQFEILELDIQMLGYLQEYLDKALLSSSPQKALDHIEPGIVTVYELFAAEMARLVATASLGLTELRNAIEITPLPVRIQKKHDAATSSMTDMSDDIAALISAIAGITLPNRDVAALLSAINGTVGTAKSTVTKNLMTDDSTKIDTMYNNADQEATDRGALSTEEENALNEFQNNLLIELNTEALADDAAMVGETGTDTTQLKKEQDESDDEMIRRRVINYLHNLIDQIKEGKSGNTGLLGRQFSQLSTYFNGSAEGKAQVLAVLQSLLDTFDETKADASLNTQVMTRLEGVLNAKW